MSRTLIRNISAQAQTLPALYGGFVVAVGHGRVVADETSVAVNELGGFAAMDGKWVVMPVSTDTMLGDFDVEANGVAMLATFVPGGGGDGGPVDWADLTGKPSFATVATSGSYTDLSNKPVLADVATSGAYADLSGTPTIPSASNSTPTDVAATAAAGVQAGFARADHQHAHGSQAGGSLHAAATSLSAGFMSAADKAKVDGLASVATSGAYADLSGKPTLATVATTGTYSDLTGKPSLATVATSGSYSDLSGKPSLATVATTGAYADLSGKPDKTYDIASYANGALAANQTIAQVLAPKNLTLTALAQTGGATVVVKVNGTNASYPQSVTTGQVISVVVTVAGNSNTFTISAVEA